MTLAAWLHTLNPVALRLWGDFAVRWYGVAYLAGFVCAYLILIRLARRGLIRIPAERVGDAMMWLILGVLVGGRLGYVLVYDREALVTFTRSFPFWGLLAIHHGGMASHGGMVGVILAAWRISRGWRDDSGALVGRCSPLHVMDTTALICPFGLFFGRIANFVNGELLGRIVSPPGTPGPWWSVQYPQELKGWAPALADRAHAPVDPAPPLAPEQAQQLQDLLGSLDVSGREFNRALEFVIEHPAKFASELRPILSSRHPSQLYQALAEGLVLGAILWLLWARPRRAGIIGIAFLISYGALRILTEFWRLPDPQFGDDGRPWGLSRGQWLSAAMIAVGLVAIPFVLKFSTQRLGGWATRRPDPLATPDPPSANA